MLSWWASPLEFLFNTNLPRGRKKERKCIFWMQPEPEHQRIITWFVAPIPLSGVIEHDTSLRRQQVGHVTCRPIPPSNRRRQQQQQHRLGFLPLLLFLVTLAIRRCDCRRPPHAGAVPELVWSACRVRIHMCVRARLCARGIKVSLLAAGACLCQAAFSGGSAEQWPSVPAHT